MYTEMIKETIETNNRDVDNYRNKLEKNTNEKKKPLIVQPTGYTGSRKSVSRYGWLLCFFCFRLTIMGPDPF